MVVVLRGVGWECLCLNGEGEEGPVGRFFARGLGPSPTTDLDPPTKSNTPLTRELVAAVQVQQCQRKIAE